MKIKDIDINWTTYINYFLIGYAFCLPISKAGVNIFETLLFLFWIFEGRWKEKYLILKSNLLVISIALLIFISFISLPHASSLEFGLRYIGKYRHFLVIFIILTSLQKEYVKTILSAFLSGMLISEIISYGIFFEWWHFKDVPPNDPSPFMSHTDYSIYLSFTAMILLVRILDPNESFKSKILYALFFITVTSNLFLNGGRTGQVTYIILTSIVFFTSIQHKLKAFISVTVLLSMIFFLAYTFSPVFQSRFEQAKIDINNMVQKQDCRGSFATRTVLWRVGTYKFLDHFWIGEGIGNDMKDVEKYAKELDCLTNVDYSDHHNSLITLANLYGIGGVIIFFLFFYSLIKLKFRTRKYQILNYVFIAAFFLWSMGGITFHTMNPMVFFALFAGLFSKISMIETTSS